MKIQHQELAQGRWATMSLVEQMANIGKEILRTREALVDFFFGDNTFGSSEKIWHKYFDSFACAFQIQKKAS